MWFGDRCSGAAVATAGSQRGGKKNERQGSEEKNRLED